MSTCLDAETESAGGRGEGGEKREFRHASEFFAAQFDVSDLRIAEAVVLRRRARDCSLREETGVLLASGSSMLFNALLKGGPRGRTELGARSILMGLYILSDMNRNLLGGSGNCC